MKPDEEIERERAALEPLIGPTRAGWYAEACLVEYGDLPEKILWCCRYREMAMEAGRLEAKIAKLQAVVDAALRDSDSMTTTVLDALDALDRED